MRCPASWGPVRRLAALGRGAGPAPTAIPKASEQTASTARLAAAVRPLAVRLPRTPPILSVRDEA
jgi:hypothetical protein